MLRQLFRGHPDEMGFKVEDKENHAGPHPKELIQLAEARALFEGLDLKVKNRSK